METGRPRKEKKEAAVSFRFTPTAKQMLEELASADQVSQAKLLERLLRQEVQRRARKRRRLEVSEPVPSQEAR
jgi:hypothetical protein